jgi:hypothetical protein
VELGKTGMANGRDALEQAREVTFVAAVRIPPISPY